MPNSVVTKVVSERFERWAASLSIEEQATLAEWMGVAEDAEVRADLERGSSDSASTKHENVARRLIGKVRRFSESELDDDERRMLNLLLMPGITQVVGTRQPDAVTASSEPIVLPRGLSSVLPTAISAAAEKEGVRVVGLVDEDAQT
jgi:hypothetical protein